MQNLCLNISCVNWDHLGNAPRETPEGFKLNYVECYIDDANAEILFAKLKNEHGVLESNYYGSSCVSFYNIINIVNYLETTRLRSYLANNILFSSFRASKSA